MEENTQVSVIESQDTALYLLTKAEIDIAIATAKAFPRSVKQSIDRAKSIAGVSQAVAASCTYAVPRDGKNITGPSVRLAEIMCSSWGNINSGARIVNNDGKRITAQGVCHDLETNNRITIEVVRKITYKDGRTYSEDMQTTAGNAACAIAFRNAVYKAIPSAIVNEVWEAAKDVAKGDVATLPARRAKAIEFFKAKGVTDKQILTTLEVKKMEDIDLDKLYLLAAMKTSIEVEGVTIESLFSKTPESKKESMKEKAKAGEQSSIPMP